MVSKITNKNAGVKGDYLRMTMQEVEETRENGDERTLIVISGKIYDVSKWKSNHPGGYSILNMMKGRDSTDPFLVSHTEVAKKKLKYFCVGEVTDSKQNQMQKEFHELDEQLKKDGMYKTSYAWYAYRWAILFTHLAVAVYMSLRTDNLFICFAGALLLGLFFQQVSFMGHDFGHNSVFHEQKKDFYGGFLVTSLLGVSGQWWKATHNVHHTITNSVHYDPDIQHIPIFATSKLFFNSVFSEYHKRELTFDAAAKTLIPFQHLLFYPILLMARINLFIQSIIFCLLSKDIRHRHLEFLAMAIYWTWYGPLLASMPSWTVMIAHFLLTNLVAGVLHIQIVLSHFCMNAYEGAGFNEERGFVETQLETSLDISCSPWMDWFHGGLQFQVAHHLFPHVPRHNLRTLREQYLKPFFRKHNMIYHEASFIDANVRTFYHMKEKALACNKRYPSYSDTPLFKLLNAEG